MADWKGYDTSNVKPMSYFACPGNLQLAYYDKCKKAGINPHRDLQNIIEKRLVELGSDVVLEELKRQRIELDARIAEYEKSRRASLDEKLVAYMASVVEHIMASHDKGNIPTTRYLYYAIKNVARRCDAQFNDVLQLLKQRLAEALNDDEEYLEQLFIRLDQVAARGNNGLLTDDEVNRVLKWVEA